MSTQNEGTIERGETKLLLSWGQRAGCGRDLSDEVAPQVGSIWVMKMGIRGQWPCRPHSQSVSEAGGGLHLLKRVWYSSTSPDTPLHPWVWICLSVKWEQGCIFALCFIQRLKKNNSINYFVAVVIQSLSHILHFATPWTAARQASRSFTISQSLLKLMFIESVMLSNHLIFCHLLLLCLQSFPASGSFLMSRLFPSGGQSTGASALGSVLPTNIQGWFPLGLTGLISLLSKGLSGVFSSLTVWKHQFFSA